MTTLAEIVADATKRRYPGVRYIGPRVVAGGVVPVLRVKAWREPNEDGQLRELEAAYLGPLMAGLILDQHRRNLRIVKEINSWT